MAFGLGVLRLSSREFWAMTPREFEAAVRGMTGAFATGGEGAPSLAEVRALMEAFPDGEDVP